MTKVLLYENRKVDPTVWDVSTADKAAAGWLALFNHLNTMWGVYEDLSAPLAWDAEPSEQHRLYHAAAKLGDAEAAKQLLHLRRKSGDEGEYEQWIKLDVRDPLVTRR